MTSVSDDVLLPAGTEPASVFESCEIRTNSTLDPELVAIGLATNSEPLGVEEEAFVTLVLDDDIAVGAEVMLHSLREHSRTQRPRVVMCTDGVSECARLKLHALADDVVEVRRFVGGTFVSSKFLDLPHVKIEHSLRCRAEATPAEVPFRRYAFF